MIPGPAVGCGGRARLAPPGREQSGWEHGAEAGPAPCRAPYSVALSSRLTLLAHRERGRAWRVSPRSPRWVGQWSWARPELGTTEPHPGGRLRTPDAKVAVVGEGFHAYAGGPHAEIVALTQAGSGPGADRRGPAGALRSPRVTPPMQHRALIRGPGCARFSTVRDPTPSGRRRETLRAAGVEVEALPPSRRTGSIAWLTARRAAALPDLEGRRHPRRALRRRSTAPACRSPRRRRGWTCTPIATPVDAVTSG